MLGSLIQDGRRLPYAGGKSLINQNLELLSKKELTKRWQKSFRIETLTEMQKQGITEKIVTKYGLDADETLPGESK